MYRTCTSSLFFPVNPPIILHLCLVRALSNYSGNYAGIITSPLVCTTVSIFCLLYYTILLFHCGSVHSVMTRCVVCESKIYTAASQMCQSSLFLYRTCTSSLFFPVNPQIILHLCLVRALSNYSGNYAGIITSPLVCTTVSIFCLLYYTILLFHCGSVHSVMTRCVVCESKIYTAASQMCQSSLFLCCVVPPGTQT